MDAPQARNPIGLISRFKKMRVADPDTTVNDSIVVGDPAVFWALSTVRPCNPFVVQPPFAAVGLELDWTRVSARVAPRPAESCRASALRCVDASLTARVAPRSAEGCLAPASACVVDSCFGPRGAPRSPVAVELGSVRDAARAALRLAEGLCDVDVERRRVADLLEGL